MTASPAAATPEADETRGIRSWIQRHFQALLYGWFWFGMFLCGLVAPADRVKDLGSGLITEGWHLSAMACGFGGPILIAYWLRMSGRWR